MTSRPHLPCVVPSPHSFRVYSERPTKPNLT